MDIENNLEFIHLVVPYNKHHSVDALFFRTKEEAEGYVLSKQNDDLRYEYLGIDDSTKYSKPILVLSPEEYREQIDALKDVVYDLQVKVEALENESN